MRFNFNEYSDVLREHFNEATYMEFSTLCRDIANREPQDGITVRQGSDKIREKMLEEMEKHLSKEPTLHVRGDLTNNRNDIQEVYDNRHHL